MENIIQHENDKPLGKRPSVLLMEPNSDGHRGPYAAWMAKGLNKRGVRVTLVTQVKSSFDPCYREINNFQERDGGEGVRIFPLEAPLLEAFYHRGNRNLVVSQFLYWRLFREWHNTIATSVAADVIFIPYLDYCFYAIAMLGSPFGNYPWVGLPMGPKFHFHYMGIVSPPVPLVGLKKFMFFRVFKNRFLRNLITIDESLYEYLDQNKLNRKKMVMLPEPAEFDNLPAPGEAKKQLGLQASRRLILVYGTITQRKGIVDLVKALQHQMFPSNVDVLFAGRLQSDAIPLFMSPAVCELVSKKRVQLIDRFIENEEVAKLMAAADIVWLGYRSHYGPSGVLIQAERAGVPVIACEEGVIGWRTRRYGLGKVVKPSDIGGVIKAVKALCECDVENPGKELNRVVQTKQQSFANGSIDALMKALHIN